MLPVHHGKLQGVAHGEPEDALSAFGITTRYDALNLAAVKMEVLVGCFGVVSSKPQEIEQKVIDGVGGGNGV